MSISHYLFLYILTKYSSRLVRTIMVANIIRKDKDQKKPQDTFVSLAEKQK